MKKRENEITFNKKPVTILGERKNVGDKAENFTVLNMDLEEVEFKDFRGKTKIISVVPSIDTPVCANQTKRFNSEATNYDNVVVLTISVDLPFALNRFCAAEGIENVLTLSDHRDLDFGKKYGFVIEELRLLTRGVMIIDNNDKIRSVEYVKEVTEYPDFDKVMEKLEKII